MGDLIQSNVEWFDKNAATPEMRRLAEERDSYRKCLVMVLKVVREFVTRQANTSDLLVAYCNSMAADALWLQHELALARAQLPKDVAAETAEVKTGGTDGISILDQGFITDGEGNFWSRRCPSCGKDTMSVVRPGKVQCSECG